MAAPVFCFDKYIGVPFCCFLFVQKTPQGSFAGFNLHNFFEKYLAIFLRMY